MGSMGGSGDDASAAGTNRATAAGAGFSFAFRRSLSYRQAVRALLAALLIGVLLSAVEVGWAVQRERDKLSVLTGQVLDLAEGGASSAVWHMDDTLAREIARSVMAIGSVRAVEIYIGPDQKFWGQSRHSYETGVSALSQLVFGDLLAAERLLYRPGQAGGQRQTIGRLRVEMDPPSVARDFIAYASATALGGMARNIVLAIVLALVVHRFLTRPLRDVGRAVAAIDPARPGGSLLPVPADHATDELGFVVGRFNETLAELGDSQRALRDLATRDGLTGLPNRVLLLEALTRALAHPAAGGRCVAVLFMDLDRFKHVNDSLGHEIGDELLREVGARLEGCLRPGDLLGRLGGDEFLVIAEGVSGQAEAAAIAERICRTVARPLLIGGHALHASTSVGIALSGEGADDATTLLRQADTAMYAAKAEGTGRFQFFAREMTERAMVRLRTEASLREALENHAFELHFQPKVSTRDRAVVGAEALLRWRHQGRYVSPAEFIPVAEDSGLIVELGAWVFQEACRHAAAWRGALDDFHIAVNVSARQVAEEGFTAMVEAALERYRIPPGLIEIEVTESIMVNSGNTLQVLRDLRGKGLRIAVDDFGTGYSSLAYLRQLPVTTVKIDRSFVVDLPMDNAIAAMILALGQRLGLEVVAEGVEREDQLEWLAEEGCPVIQGFMIAKPMPAAEFERQFLPAATLVPLAGR
ncbi:MAG TPA: EAL domain-containing protein [Azospirillaceae bacterium]|nr:EAL domain-containing protein [Azospirillaceae bacterium]